MKPQLKKNTTTSKSSKTVRRIFKRKLSNLTVAIPNLEDLKKIGRHRRTKTGVSETALTSDMSPNLSSYTKIKKISHKN